MRPTDRLGRVADIELAAIDLNLLLALDALLAERHVTRAARRARASQPAMSRSLARLREVFDDPLLVRGGSELRLTPRAEALVEPLKTTLATVRGMVASPRFDPARAIGTCRIAATDDVALLLVSRLLPRMQAEAPGLAIVIVPWTADWHRRLVAGDVTLTFGVPHGHESDVRSRELFRDRWVSVLRADHPALAKPWTARRFAALDHMLFTVDGGGPGQVDDALAALGLSRRVALRVPWGALMPVLVSQTDLVCTTSWQVATQLARVVPLELREPPVPLPPLRFPMVWHERDHHDPQHAWLRGMIVSAAQDLPTPPRVRKESRRAR
jgi:DNA-binding transcriptional LysR family regulator